MLRPCSHTGTSVVHCREVDDKSPVNREVHAGIRESRGVRLPPATRPTTKPWSEPYSAGASFFVLPRLLTELLTSSNDTG